MNFKKCANCESENPESEVYCLECGEKLEPDKTLKRPPSQVAGALAESAPPEPPTAMSKPPAEPAASAPPSPEVAPALPEASLLPPLPAPSGLLKEKAETEAPPKSVQAAPPPSPQTPPPATKAAASGVEPAPARRDRVRADNQGKPTQPVFRDPAQDPAGGAHRRRRPGAGRGRVAHRIGPFTPGRTGRRPGDDHRRGEPVCRSRGGARPRRLR